MRLTWYHNQVDLMLDILPAVLEDPRVALKGGTAINFFYFDMPRLSVDIDLCYLPLEDRAKSFKNIHDILKNIKIKLEELGFNVRSSKKLDGDSEVKLTVYNNQAEIKVEPNFTVRGAVFEPEIKTLKQPVIETFNKDVTTLCLSFADLMGSKMCAALDRQHPRDLFDVKYFLDRKELTEEIRKSFVVYLISHARPMQELLNPNLKDLSERFNEEFKGMITSRSDVDIDDLIDARLNLIETIRKKLTISEKKFILSLKNLSPDWQLLGIEKAKNLPAVQWKIINLKKMSASKRKEQLKILEEILCV